jgi:hypothetical protein
MGALSAALGYKQYERTHCGMQGKEQLYVNGAPFAATLNVLKTMRFPGRRSFPARGLASKPTQA